MRPEPYFKGKIVKLQFWRKLKKEFGTKGWTANEGPTDVPPFTSILTLYYQNDVHVASWENGEGWIFKAPEKVT